MRAIVLLVCCCVLYCLCCVDSVVVGVLESCGVACGALVAYIVVAIVRVKKKCHTRHKKIRVQNPTGAYAGCFNQNTCIVVAIVQNPRTEAY